jgi:hypothetical protein
MKNETFYQAKKLNDQIDELTKYINNLIRAKATCSRLVKISYSVGSYGRNSEMELRYSSKDFVKEMLVKELERAKLERDELQNEFNSL